MFFPLEDVLFINFNQTECVGSHIFTSQGIVILDLL